MLDFISPASAVETPSAPRIVAETASELDAVLGALDEQQLHDTFAEIDELLFGAAAGNTDGPLPSASTPPASSPAPTAAPGSQASTKRQLDVASPKKAKHAAGPSLSSAPCPVQGKVAIPRLAPRPQHIPTLRAILPKHSTACV